jgi:hypothetical protein
LSQIENEKSGQFTILVTLVSSRVQTIRDTRQIIL